jgi:hypothetical protein
MGFIYCAVCERGMMMWFAMQTCGAIRSAIAALPNATYRVDVTVMA